MREFVSREEFDSACEAVWSEIQYQDGLYRRTADEASNVPSFLTLLRRYLRKAENDWSDNPGVEQPDGTVQVSAALHGLRKIAAIAVRAMIYSGVRHRESVTPSGEGLS